MSRIRRANTRPELTIRRLLHSLGYRYRIHLATVPGRPDVAFPRRHKVIQVHGCFWHAHGCSLARVPKSRTEFWQAKFARNKERDARLARAAEQAGWQILTVWECDLDDLDHLTRRLMDFLGPPRMD